MNPWIVLPVLALIAVVYVMVPVGVALWAYYRRARLVPCPETRVTALVAVDAIRAGLGEAFGRPELSVTSCALWPERQGCGQGCLRAAPGGESRAA